MKKTIFLIFIITFSFTCNNRFSYSFHNDVNNSMKSFSTQSHDPENLDTSSSFIDRYNDTVKSKEAEQGLNIDDLTKMVFFGIDPIWRLIFNKSNMILDVADGEPIIIKHNNNITSFTDIKTQIFGTKNSKNYTINIKKERCRDGMTGNLYRHSMVIIKDREIIYSGCGRKVNLKEAINRFNNQLNVLIDKLAKNHVSGHELHYDPDIKNFEFYKNNKYLKNFVNCLLDMGYDVIQKGESYHLSIDK